MTSYCKTFRACTSNEPASQKRACKLHDHSSFHAYRRVAKKKGWKMLTTKTSRFVSARSCSLDHISYTRIDLIQKSLLQEDSNVQQSEPFFKTFGANMVTGLTSHE